MSKKKITSDDFLKMLNEEEKDSSIMWSTPSKAVDPKAEIRDEKLETNCRQTKDITKDKPQTNQGQTGDKVETKNSETGDKVETQPRTQLETNCRQTKDKLETKISFSELVGLQRDLVIFFYESCKVTRAPFTDRLTIEHIISSCKTSASSVKKTIQRLENKGVIHRKDFKNGRGGWTRYELPNGIYQELLQFETRDKLETNWRQTEDKVESQPKTQPRTTVSSSSSVFNNNITTTESNIRSFSDWLETVNLDLVQNVGVTKSVLQRCFDLFPSLTPEQLDDLLFRFSEFLREPNNRVQNARGFFISLAKQVSEGQTPLDHIETPGERFMREYAQKIREKKERVAKLEQETLEFEFEHWLEQLDPEKQKKLVPESPLAKHGSVPHRIALKQYFSETIWPSRRKDILDGAQSL